MSAPRAFASTALVIGLLCAPAAYATPPVDEAPAGSPHAEPGTHTAAEGGHGGKRGEINWVSFDYRGEHSKFTRPPLLFAIINFAILLYLLVRFVRKPMGSYLQERHERIRRDLEEAAELRERAQARLREIDEKLDKLDAEVAEIRESVARDAKEEKSRLIADAEREAERIVANAEKTLADEIARVKRRLEVSAVQAAVEASEKLLRSSITATDHNRLREEYFAQLRDTGTHGANG